MCYIRYTPVVYGCVCVSVYVFTVVLHTLYACGVDGVDGVDGVAGVDGIGGVDGLDKWVCCERHCASYSVDAPISCLFIHPCRCMMFGFVSRAYNQYNSWAIRVVGGY